MNVLHRRTLVPVRSRPRALQRGVTLIELMVSMAIGLALVGALVLTYLGNAQSTRTSMALTQMSEDGQAALALMTQQLRQADYNPRLPAPAGVRDLQTGGFGFFACDAGFQSVSAAFASLQCNTGTGPAAMAVTYVADRFNTVPTAATPPGPTDCVGNGVPSITDAAGAYYVVQNRFYVDGGNLMCAGNGATSPFSGAQPFVENIDDLVVNFGVAAPLPPVGGVAGYMTAAQLGPIAGSSGVFNDADFMALAPAARWGRVLSVRVCVVMRSAVAVVPALESAPQHYVDCRGKKIRTVDGVLRRAFAATVLLRNRVAAS